MKIKILAVCCIIFSACKSGKEATYNKQMKESFQEEFKIKYFKRLLLEGFNKSNEIKSVLRSDKSGYGEPILSIDDLNLIDSLVKIDNEILVKDSITRIGHTSEGSQGKHILGYALSKYQSKLLDSLAKARAKIFIKTFNSE